VRIILFLSLVYKLMKHSHKLCDKFYFDSKVLFSCQVMPEEKIKVSELHLHYCKMSVWKINIRVLLTCHKLVIQLAQFALNEIILVLSIIM